MPDRAIQATTPPFSLMDRPFLPLTAEEKIIIAAEVVIVPTKWKDEYVRQKNMCYGKCRARSGFIFGGPCREHDLNQHEAMDTS